MGLGLPRRRGRCDPFNNCGERMDKKGISRAWGAVWTDDGPVAEVRDYDRDNPDSEAAFAAMLRGTEFRWFALADLDVKLTKKYHTNGKCSPGAVCRTCQDYAPAHWFRAIKRDKQRIYQSARETARVPNRYDSADYGPPCDTEEGAIVVAKFTGAPWVVVRDGHYRTLRWIEVPRG